jgi:NAD(P)H-hydrate epimerase
LENYAGKLVFDADALNSLAQFSDGALVGLLKNKKCDVILTPHCKEFSRLSGLSVEEILEDSISAAKDFARLSSTPLLLKNAISVITDGDEVFLNAVGNSGQAKGGSGDVLAGVLAGLCAMGLPAYEGGVLAAYLAGKSAELAARDIGEYSLTASDLIAYLPKAFLFVTKDTDKNGGEE